MKRESVRLYFSSFCRADDRVDDKASVEPGLDVRRLLHVEGLAVNRRPVERDGLVLSARECSYGSFVEYAGLTKLNLNLIPS